MLSLFVHGLLLSIVVFLGNDWPTADPNQGAIKGSWNWGGSSAGRGLGGDGSLESAS